MISFFRRIRQQLLQAGNFRKYLFYALGEIILVVLGILIALQVNNWNQQSNERTTEIKLLTQFKSDLERSLRDIEGNIAMHDQAILSGDIIKDHFDKNKPYHDSLATHFSFAFVWSRLVLNLAAYETIKSHGIEIISNEDLRDEMVSLLEGSLFFFRQIEDNLVEYSEHLRKGRKKPE